jgi:TetR/AcrR family transcriptional repressor of nem operon
MKRSKEDAAETRRHIVSAAAHEFMANGLQISVPDLMSAAGLTHGGFYRHFESKEELIKEACEEAMSSIIKNLISGARKGSNEQILRKVIESYLSSSHKEKRGNGCPMAALGSELTRADDAIRDRVLAEAAELTKFIAELLDPKRFNDAHKEAQLLFSSMIGAMTVARMMTDAKASNAFLRSATEKLLEQYC